MLAVRADVRAGGPASSVFASSPGWVYYQRGADYLRNRSETCRGQSAITMLHRAVEADAKLAIAWAALGGYWRRFERTPETSSREAARRRPGPRHRRRPARSANARGRGFLVMGRYDGAWREFGAPSPRCRD
jgi:hypothetical protein